MKLVFQFIAKVLSKVEVKALSSPLESTPTLAKDVFGQVWTNATAYKDTNRFNILYNCELLATLKHQLGESQHMGVKVRRPKVWLFSVFCE